MFPSDQSEPQFQSPDDRNSEISIQQPQQTYPEQPQPQPRRPREPRKMNKTIYYYDEKFPSELFNKIKNNRHVLNRLDWYGNMIPLGSFCFAVSFIIYGFYRCKAFEDNESFMWSMIALFGGIGQATAGFLEYIKGRTFPASIYTIYGGYCLSHYFFYTIPYTFDTDSEMVYGMNSPSMCAYYSAWVVISFAILLASCKVNILFVLQCATCLVFFLLRAIGEGCGSLHTKRNAAGILQVISGFFSLLVFISQVLNNEVFRMPVFPTVPLADNKIDLKPRLPPATAPTQ